MRHRHVAIIPSPAERIGPAPALRGPIREDAKQRPRRPAIGTWAHRVPNLGVWFVIDLEPVARP